MMCCQTDTAHGHGHATGGECGCGCGGHSFRRFFTMKEEQERLESYRDQLQQELAAVQERIKEFKAS